MISNISIEYETKKKFRRVIFDTDETLINTTTPVPGRKYKKRVTEYFLDFQKRGITIRCNLVTFPGNLLCVCVRGGHTPLLKVSIQRRVGVLLFNGISALVHNFMPKPSL